MPTFTSRIDADRFNAECVARDNRARKHASHFRAMRGAFWCVAVVGAAVAFPPAVLGVAVVVGFACVVAK